MAIGPVVTRGYGTFGTRALVVTRGYLASAPTQARKVVGGGRLTREYREVKPFSRKYWLELRGAERAAAALEKTKATTPEAQTAIREAATETRAVIEAASKVAAESSDLRALNAALEAARLSETSVEAARFSRAAATLAREISEELSLRAAMAAAEDEEEAALLLLLS